MNIESSEGEDVGDEEGEDKREEGDAMIHVYCGRIIYSVIIVHVYILLHVLPVRTYRRVLKRVKWLVVKRVRKKRDSRTSSTLVREHHKYLTILTG